MSMHSGLDLAECRCGHWHKDPAAPCRSITRGRRCPCPRFTEYHAPPLQNISPTEPPPPPRLRYPAAALIAMGLLAAVPLVSTPPRDDE